MKDANVIAFPGWPAADERAPTEREILVVILEENSVAMDEAALLLGHLAKRRRELLSAAQGDRRDCG